MKPARNLLLLLGAWLALAVPASLWPTHWMPSWKAFGAAMALLALVDALLALRSAFPALDRKVAQVLPVGAWSTVEARLANPGRLRRNLRIFDGVPAAMDSRHMPQEITVAAGGWAELTYRVRPNHRGPFLFQPASVLMASPFGLWWRHRRLGPATPVKVFPNFAPV